MALFGLFEKKYTLEMLDEHLRKLRQNGKSDSAYRCKILIIDDKIEDESYPLAEELRLLRDKQTYNLTLKTDLENLTDASGYDLIICDNQGIGVKICGSRGNGISLLKLLINEYPGKRYVMMSDKEIKINRLESFSRLSAKINVWDKRSLVLAYQENGEGGLADHIAQEVDKVLNPLERWKEIRRSFVVNTNIALTDLAKVENAYIKSIIRNNPQFYEREMVKISNAENDKQISSYLKATKSIIEFTISILSLI